ncbi:unnamed protein product [Candida verbasci]|uniref:Seipin n=1 Tax=Candida verbasci TaxID=1227364 RepID=A0A9W4XAN8_9ASCO|nr:unnamed protein product [Candida verbasci]
MNWLRFFGLVLPLTLTRQWLYFTTTLSTSIFILLPLSIITYTQYYKTLIPLNSSPIQNLNFTKTGNPSISKFYHYSNSIFANYSNFDYDSELKYITNLNLRIICPQAPTTKKVSYTFQSNFSIVSQGSFILDCDSHLIYSHNNWIIPHNLKFWVPPILTTLSNSQKFNIEICEFKGSDLKGSNQEFSLILNDHGYLIDDSGYLIDDNFSNLRFDVKWTGFRYYLVKYYYTCFAFGTLVFFLISGAISILTSYAILFINYNKNKRAQSTKIKIKKEKGV